MKIYTKKGDGGKTSLINRKEVSKDDAWIEALGSIDETNAAIGVTLSLLPDQSNLTIYRKQLISIQKNLFEIGALVANLSYPLDNLANQTLFLENWIDAMDRELPPLHNFILPGGHPCAAAAHLARSLSRKAERRMVALKNATLAPSLIYFNRLSDYLFMLARSINFILKKDEIIWK